MADFIISYVEPYDSPLRTSKHHFIGRLANDGHRVLMLEVTKVATKPSDILQALREFFSFSASKKMAPNIYSVRFVVPFPYTRRGAGFFDFLLFNTLNQLSILPRLRREIKHLQLTDPIMIVYFPFIFPIIKYLEVSKIIFHMVDEWQGLKSIPPSMGRLTSKLLQQAELTIFTSQPLFDRYGKFSKKAKLIRHGSDLELFKPKQIAKVNVIEKAAPKVGYYGAIHKLDFNLVEKVATELKSWQFEFVGPISDTLQGIDLQMSLPNNVKLNEPKPRKELPLFLSSLDVFWCPFETNELSTFMSPIKLFEVLSFGLPIVCQELPECRAILGECGSLAQSPKQHVDALIYECNSDNRTKLEQRRFLVKDSDWASIYKTFITEIESVK